jgi:hypothetical protein
MLIRSMIEGLQSSACTNPGNPASRMRKRGGGKHRGETQGQTGCSQNHWLRTVGYFSDVIVTDQDGCGSAVVSSEASPLLLMGCR